MIRGYLKILVFCLMPLLLLALSGCEARYWRKQTNEIAEFIWGMDKSVDKGDLKMKIAVLPFEDQARLGDPEVEEKLAIMLTKQLDQADEVVVAPWSEVEAYMIQNMIPRPVSAGSATLIGRALGLNALVLGTVTEVSQAPKKTGLIKFVPLTIPYINEEHDVVTAVLVIKVIDPDSGAVLGANVGEGEILTGQTEEEILLGGQSRSLEQELMDRSLADAVNLVVEQIYKALDRSAWKGFIESVDGGTAVLAAGSEVGIRVGDEFQVFEVGEKVTNAAGQTYVIPGPLKASLEASSVGPRSTVVTIVSGEVYPGDTAYYKP